MRGIFAALMRALGMWRTAAVLEGAPLVPPEHQRNAGAYRRGWLQAEQDIAAGDPKRLISGLVVGGTPSEGGVRNQYTGCLVTDELLAFHAGNNDRIAAHLRDQAHK